MRVGVGKNSDPKKKSAMMGAAGLSFFFPWLEGTVEAGDRVSAVNEKAGDYNRCTSLAHQSLGPRSNLIRRAGSFFCLALGEHGPIEVPPGELGDVESVYRKGRHDDAGKKTPIQAPLQPYLATSAVTRFLLQWDRFLLMQRDHSQGWRAVPLSSWAVRKIFSLTGRQISLHNYTR